MSNITLKVKKNILLTHVPKTGGKSIKHVLNVKFSHYPLFMWSYQNKELFDKHYKIAFVRNPWDRLLSTFIYLSQYGDNEYDAMSKKIFIDSADGDFKKFVKNLNNKNIWQQLHLMPQHCWISNLHDALISITQNQVKNDLWKKMCSESLLIYEKLPHLVYLKNVLQASKLNKGESEIKLLPDFVGRFENIDRDWENICETTNRVYKKLPHINKTCHKHYTYYYDDETQQIVNDIYKEDINYFRYKFGELGN